jgi:hypothetical protein
MDPRSPGAEDTSLRRVYAYDPIGNRTTSKEGDPNAAPLTTYTSNNLNQYDPVVTATSRRQASGSSTTWMATSLRRTSLATSTATDRSARATWASSWPPMAGAGAKAGIMRRRT